MNNSHITFDKMSDLYDDVIPTREEKEAILNHIASCSECGSEYDRLKKTTGLLSEFRNQDYNLKDLSSSTISMIKSRRRKRSFMKVMPAIAASLFIIIGVGYFTGVINPGSNSISNNHVADNETINDTEKVIDIINDNSAKIMKVSEFFVEGEVPYDKFRKLRRDLGFRNVKYHLVQHPSSIDTVKSGGNIKWKSNIEEVGIGNMGRYGDGSKNQPGKQEKYIRFRVYK